VQPDDGRDLAELFQRTAPAAPATGCPGPERFWSAVSGELSAAEVRTLTDHSIRCADCSEALRLAREVWATAQPAEASRAPRRATRSNWLMGLALAAGVAALVTVGINLKHQETATDLERGGDAPAIRSTLPKAPQPRAALVLRWSPVPHARRYSVTVATSDLHVLFQRSGIDHEEQAVPPSALMGIPAGTRLIWRVEATLENGQSVASPAFLLDVD
jgi:hypothetical protein